MFIRPRFPCATLCKPAPSACAGRKRSAASRMAAFGPSLPPLVIPDSAAAATVKSEQRRGGMLLARCCLVASRAHRLHTLCAWHACRRRPSLLAHSIHSTAPPTPATAPAGTPKRPTPGSGAAPMSLELRSPNVLSLLQSPMPLNSECCCAACHVSEQPAAAGAGGKSGGGRGRGQACGVLALNCLAGAGTATLP